MGRRWGKTFMAGSYALACADLGAAVAWVAPTYKNTRALWRFAEMHTAPVRGLVRMNRAELEMSFPSGGRLGIYTADNDVALRGESFDVVIVDEAARIRGETYTDVIMPTLADREGRCLLISTPKGKNWFWQEWIRGQQDTTEVASFQAPSAANPMPQIRRAAILARERVPERSYRQEWLAEFVEDGGGVFRSVRECATAVAQESPIAGHQYIVGCDWGRANDFTVFTVMDATTKELARLDRSNQVEYAIQRGRLVALCERFKPDAVIAEANAMGEPIIEQLQRDGLPVQPFVTTNATKAKAVDDLALAFERGAIKILNDPTLVTELQAYEAERLPSGMVRYSAPEGMHDDCVMSLALAWQGCVESGPLLLWGNE